MREDKLSFGILIRIFISLLPILFGMPSVAMIICAYTIAMTFVTIGPMATVVSSLTAVAGAMFLSSSLGAAGELFGLSLGIQAVLCAIGCINGLFKKRDFYKGLVFSTLGILLPQFFYARHTAHAEGISLAQMMVPSSEEFKVLINQTFGTLPQNANDILAQSGITVESVATVMRDLTIMIIPSAFIISSMVFAYIVMWSVTVPIRKYPNERIHSFSKIKLSRVCTVLILVLIASVIYTAGMGNIIVNSVTINMLIVLIALAFFSGISLIEFYLRKSISFRFLRVIIHITIATNFFPVYILAAFIDSFVNFRKLPKSTDIKGGEAFETKK